MSLPDLLPDSLLVPQTMPRSPQDLLLSVHLFHHSAALEELMAKGYVSWKDDFQNILGTITINLDVLKEED